MIVVATVEPVVAAAGRIEMPFAMVGRERSIGTAEWSEKVVVLRLLCEVRSRSCQWRVGRLRLVVIVVEVFVRP